MSDVSATNQDFHKLIKAATDGKVNRVKEMLDREISPNVANSFGKTPLMEAAHNGHVSVVNLLLKRGARVDDLNNNGETAVFAAASEGHTDVVKELIQAEADLNNTPVPVLVEAATQQHTGVVRALLDAGVSVDATTNFGSTAVMEVAHRGYKEMLELLLNEPTANIDFKNKNGATALMGAAFKGHINVVKSLIDRKASINLTNIEERSALSVAVKSRHTKVIEYLIEKGASVDSLSTPLEIALQENAGNDVMELLLDGEPQIQYVDDILQRYIQNSGIEQLKWHAPLLLPVWWPWHKYLVEQPRLNTLRTHQRLTLAKMMVEDRDVGERLQQSLVTMSKRREQRKNPQILSFLNGNDDIIPLSKHMTLSEPETEP